MAAATIIMKGCDPMGHFPLFLDLTDKPVLLVGRGPETDFKAAKLLPYAPHLRRLDHLTAADLDPTPVLVVVGDLDWAESEVISHLCREQNIPVNVVDKTELCTFYFPALISRGPLTVGISTAGVSPAAAAILRQQYEAQLPDRTEEILQWANTLRGRYPGPVIKAAVKTALEQNRPLTEAELAVI